MLSWRWQMNTIEEPLKYSTWQKRKTDSEVFRRNFFTRCTCVQHLQNLKRNCCKVLIGDRLSLQFATFVRSCRIELRSEIVVVKSCALSPTFLEYNWNYGSTKAGLAEHLYPTQAPAKPEEPSKNKDLVSVIQPKFKHLQNDIIRPFLKNFSAVFHLWMILEKANWLTLISMQYV